MNKTGKGEVDGTLVSVLTDHRGGEAMNELGAALRELAGAVQLIGKSGTVTLKLKLAIAQGTSNALIISDDIKVNLPKEEKQGSIFYADSDNNLVRNDPKQFNLPLAIELAPAKATPAVDLAQPTTMRYANAVDVAVK